MEIAKNKIINILFILLIIVEPFLELIFFNSTNLSVFGLQLATLLRLALFGVLSLFMIFNIKKLKHKKYVIIYIIFIIIYFICHHLNALNFNSHVPGNFHYSIIEELFYIIRMLIPIFLIYYVINSDLNNNSLKKSIYVVVGFISFLIIISNIFKFSLCSYNDNIISGNIFDWFINPGKYGYLFLASRGLFNNIIVYYLVILFLPYLIYLLFERDTKHKIIIYILVFSCLFSSFMIGTKATTLGYIIIIVLSILLNVFFSIIKKDYKFNLKNNVFLFTILLLSFFMINYAPMTNRNYTDNTIAENKQNIENNNTESELKVEKEDIIKYLDDKDKELIINDNNGNVDINKALSLIKDSEVKKMLLVEILEKYYRGYGITLRFIEESYPYTHDPFFWKDFVDNTYLFERSNNRMVIQQIYERVIEVNDNSYDRLLGFTYSRSSKIFNLERDFLYQYYSLGLLGSILLLAPYILIVIISIVYMLIHFKNKVTFKNCSLLLGIGLTLCLAYYSGNTIDNLAITIPLGIMCGYLIKNILVKNNEK